MICEWANKDKFTRKYHDIEFGKINHDDRYIFEMMVLEFMQAGLSWSIVLKKRESMRREFDNFNFNIIKDYDEKKIDELLKNKEIIRNKLKIKALISNAKSFIKVREEFKSFDNYIWSFTKGKQIINKIKDKNDIPIKSNLSIKISKDLKTRGFKFMGDIVTYSFLEAIGIINDHYITCPYR
ncbi:MAG: DNA-3-methyladenine glycosylase I [Peptoniphilaceae bacterium]|nr:DNA-3-methyladenine glycosylase I [Peptoniphilaceae bacterium]MDD7383653.1 DNA-3-methyladenine glycosylase I [Peptoniphilaceae bacterium]MDY3737824.1 DNA-3-methyladenine glycosylase I [Peptoniphilaceae bacterium]